MIIQEIIDALNNLELMEIRHELGENRERMLVLLSETLLSYDGSNLNEEAMEGLVITLNNQITDNFYDISDSTMNIVKKNVYNSCIPIAKQDDSTITMMFAELISTFFELIPEKSSKLRKICENIFSDNSTASRNFILDLFEGCCNQDALYIFKTIGDIFCDIAIDEIRNCTYPSGLKSIYNSIGYCIGLDKNNSGIFYQILEEILSKIKRFESMQDKLEGIDLISDLINDIPKSYFKYKTIEKIMDFVIDVYPKLDELEAWTIDKDEDTKEVPIFQCIIDYTSVKSGKFVKQYLFDNSILESLVKDNNWKKRVLALDIIFYSGEGCRTYYEPLLSNLLELICSLASDSHPKVRWSLCNCIGQLSTDFAPFIHENHHHILFTTVFSLTSDKEEFVSNHAAAAQFNLYNDAPKEIIEIYGNRYLDMLINQLKDLDTVTNEHIKTLSSYVDGIEHLEKEDIIYPLLLNILKEKAELHPELLPHIVYIASVKLETFRPYLPDLLNFLMEWEEKEFTDKKLHFLDESWIKLVSVMGHEFEPYFLKIVGRVMKTAAQSVETEWREGEDVNGVEVLDDASGFASTLKIEQKKEAIKLLIMFTENFGNHLEPTLNLIHHIGRNTMDSFVGEVGIYGAALIIGVGTCFKVLYGEGHEQLMYLFVAVFQKLMNYTEFEESDVIKNLIDLVENCGYAYLKYQDNAPVPLNDILHDFGKFVTEKLQTSEIELLDEDSFSTDSGKYMENNTELLEFTCQVLTTFGEAYLDYFILHWWHVQKYIFKYDNPSDCKVACYLLSDLIEHGGLKGRVHYEPCIPYIMNNLEESELVHVTVYIFGLIAEYNETMFFRFKDNIVNGLCDIGKQERNEDNNDEIDNAILGLGKIITYYYDCIDIDEIMSIWLQNMPALVDEIANTTEQFKYFQSNNAPEEIRNCIFKNDNGNISRINNLILN